MAGRARFLPRTGHPEIPGGVNFDFHAHTLAGGFDPIVDKFFMRTVSLAGHAATVFTVFTDGVEELFGNGAAGVLELRHDALLLGTGSVSGLSNIVREEIASQKENNLSMMDTITGKLWTMFPGNFRTRFGADLLIFRENQAAESSKSRVNQQS